MKKVWGRNLLKRGAALSLGLLILAAHGGWTPCRAAPEVVLPVEEDSYEYFLERQAYPPAAGEALVLTADSAGAEPDAGVWKWTIPLEKKGRYRLHMAYTPQTGTGAYTECRILINGSLPYAQLDGFRLPCEYQDAGAPEQDMNGNDIRPGQIPFYRETECDLYDYTGSYAQPLTVNLEAGENTVQLEQSEGGVRLGSLRLIPAEEPPSYAQAAKAYQAAGYQRVDTEPLFLEAEQVLCKSASTVCAVSDKTSPLTTPGCAGKVRLNTIGGSRWKTAGEYLCWNIRAPRAGLYRISFRFRQNLTNGLKSSRILMINGEIPFSEMACVTFPYATGWQTMTLGTGQEDYWFYLREGDNELRLQAGAGEMAPVLRALDGAVEKLNAIYRKLFILIGAAPDTARDYKLDSLVPEQLRAMLEQADILATCADWIEVYEDRSNAGVGLIRTMVRQLRAMGENSDVVAENFSYFKTNIGALGIWISTAKEQPLELDRLVISGSRAGELPAEAGFFRKLTFGASEFFYSFLTDYSSIGEREAVGATQDAALRVWITSGRDQAQILRNLISMGFMAEEPVNVRLELVSGATLLPATVAGIGPDVVVGGGDVVNFAMRNAAWDLSEFGDFGGVAARFPEASLIPLRYRDGVYGLPESLSFSVLFYRRDILQELGLEIPQTWEDVASLSKSLAKSHMEFGLPSGNGSFLLMLKQKGLPVYQDGGASCALDTTEAIEVFRQYTNFYVNYGFPLAFDFVNRFRSGEMPAGIADFSLYNNLQVAAPEIKGLWNFALLPGAVMADGQVDHTSMCSGTSVMILGQTAFPEQAWAFLKWWTRADVQTQYARDIESLLGASARYTSANLEAFTDSLWDKESKEILARQMQSLSALEQVPGGYFLTRHLDNAFRAVVYKGKKPMDVLYDYVYKIDRELAEKRKEFGLQEGE